MTKRIMMPVEDETGLEAKVAHHFGRAPYFAVVEFDENKKPRKSTLNRTEANTWAAPQGTHMKASLALKPDFVIAYTMGPGALNTFLRCRHKSFKSNCQHCQRQH